MRKLQPNPTPIDVKVHIRDAADGDKVRVEITGHGVKTLQYELGGDNPLSRTTIANVYLDRLGRVLDELTDACSSAEFNNAVVVKLKINAIYSARWGD